MDIIKLNPNAFKKDHWTEQETKNVELVLDFVQNVMNNHDFDYVQKNFGKGAYLQHNRNIPDGIQGLINYIKPFAKKNPEYTYDVKHVYADGEFVILHSHATANKAHRGDETKGFNITDTWKVVDGKLVEHWDSVQPINGFMRFYNWMVGGKVRNANGVF